jgi:hypothetical protein
MLKLRLRALAAAALSAAALAQEPAPTPPPKPIPAPAPTSAPIPVPAPKPLPPPRAKTPRTFSPVLGGAPAEPSAPASGGGVGTRAAALQDERATVAARKLAALLDRSRLESELVEATGLSRKSIGGVVRTLVRPRVSGDRGSSVTLTVPESALVVVIRSDQRIDVRTMDEASVERTIRMTEAAVDNAADALPEEARPSFRAWWDAKHAAMTSLAAALKDAVAATPKTNAATVERRAPRAARRGTGPLEPSTRSPDAAEPPAPADDAAEPALDVFETFPGHGEAFAPHLFVDDLARARVEAALGEDRMLRLGRIAGDRNFTVFGGVRSAEDEALRAELTAEIVRLATEGKAKEAAEVAQRLAALEPALRYRLVGPEGIALTRSADGTLRAAEPAETDAFAGATTDSRPTPESYRRAVRDAIKVDVEATRRAAEALRADAERQARDAQAFSETVRARDAAAAAEQQAAREELRKFREEQIRELRTEIDALRKEIDALRKAKEGGKEGGGR